MQRAVLQHRQPGNRCLAGTIQRGQERPLRRQTLARGAVMDRLEHLRHAAVLRAPLDPDGTLGDGRQHRFDLDGRFRHIVHRKPVEPRHGEKGRLRHALLQLHQPGLQVAAKLHHLQIGPPQHQLRTPPQRGGAHDRPGGQIGKRGGPGRDESVAHVLARQIGIQQQPFGLQRRHVLGRMNRDVDGPGQQVILDLAGKKPLAAQLLERAVDDLVTGCLDHADGERLERQIEGARQPFAGLMRLRQCQRRTARADVEGVERGGKVKRHDTSYPCKHGLTTLVSTASKKHDAPTACPRKAPHDPDQDDPARPCR